MLGETMCLKLNPLTHQIDDKTKENAKYVLTGA